MIIYISFFKLNFINLMKYILTYIIHYILEENIIIKLNYKNKINIYLLKLIPLEIGDL